MAVGHLGEACPKLAESQRLDPATGTMLNLATCYERNGQIASAWVTYKEAATAAQKADQPERAQLARKKAAELEPRLPMLTIVVPAAADSTRSADQARRGDGRTARVGHAPSGRPRGARGGGDGHRAEGLAGADRRRRARGAGLDRGSAAGRGPRRTSGASGDPAGRGAGWSAPASTRARGGGSAGLAGVGATYRRLGHGRGRVAGLVAGGIFGALAKSNNDDASAHCVGSNVCDSAGMSSDASARHSATIATIAFVAGGALTAAGIVLYLTAPSASARSGSRVGVSPLVGAATGGIALHGGW